MTNATKFKVIKDSPLTEMSIDEAEKKYDVKILSYGSEKTSYTAFGAKMIKEGYILEVEGENTYNIFRDATGHYEIDA
jgi:hypothetical protein